MPTAATLTPAAPRLERRAARRVPGHGDVWLMNHYGRTVLRCACIDASPGGLRLHVPPGYGIAAGQRYEFSGAFTGELPSPPLRLADGHWGTIVWARRCSNHRAAYVDVGIALETGRLAAQRDIPAAESTRAAPLRRNAR